MNGIVPLVMGNLSGQDYDGLFLTLIQWGFLQTRSCFGQVFIVSSEALTH